MQALALLVGFYLLGCAVLGALVTVDVIAVRLLISSSDGPDLQILFFSVPMTGFALVAVVRSMFVSTRIKSPGVPVSPDAEPELWARVRQVARAVGTRGPRRILIGHEADSAVWEQGLFLGLLPGRRSLLIGAPLLLALTPAQLDAVIAHEFGHFGNSDTRLGPLVNRGRASVLMAVRVADRTVPIEGLGTDRGRYEPRGWWFVHIAIRAYAHVFFLLTQATGRRQEYAADRISARIAGRENTAAVLADLPAICAAYQDYLDCFVYCGLPLGLLPEPAQLIGGFSALIADPERAREIEAARRDPLDGETDRYDSHPPISDRLAAVRALPDDGRPVDAASVRPAVELLRDPKGVLAVVGGTMLGNSVWGTTPVDWDHLIDAVAYHRADLAARPLVDAVAATGHLPVATPGFFLDAVDAGRLPEILGRLPRSEAAGAASGLAAREFANTVLARMLRAWILVVLADRGLVRWVHSWSRFADLDAPAGLVAAIDQALDVLFGPVPDTAALRSILAGKAMT